MRNKRSVSSQLATKLIAATVMIQAAVLSDKSNLVPVIYPHQNIDYIVSLVARYIFLTPFISAVSEVNLAVSAPVELQL